MYLYVIRIIAEYHEISLVASYYVRTVTVGDKRIVFQIWDTAGQERFRSLVPMYLRDTKIAIMMYDITSVVSLFNLAILVSLSKHEIRVLIYKVWHAYRGRLLLWKPGPIPLGLAYVLLVEANPFSELVVILRTMLFEYPSVLSRFCLLHFLQ